VLALATGTAQADVESTSVDGGVPTAGKVSAPSPEALRQVFASREFQFCHEADYPLTPAEKEWCTLGAGENKKVCPSFHEACSNDATAKQLDLREPFSIKLPELGMPVRALLWALLGVGLAVLIFALVRHFLDHKPKETVVTTQAATSAEDEAAAAFARQVETDVQRLLERAKAEAAAGDFRAAIGDAYAALLRRMEGAGLVHVEPDQTNGDYLRKVQRDRRDLGARMAEVVDAVEVAQFGDEAPTRDRFESVWGRVTSLLAERLGPALLIVWLLLSGCGQPRADWEHSPSGRAGVVTYLGKRGFDVHERLLTVAKIADSKAHQLVLLPGAQMGDDEWKAVRTWIFAGNSLVVAGGTRTLPDWIGEHVVEKAATKTEAVAATAAMTQRFGGLSIRVPGANSVEPGKGSAVVLAHKPGAYAVERWVGEGAEEDEGAEGDTEDGEEGGSGGTNLRPRILVLADDYLFRNASLLVADNAVALEALLRDGGTSVELAGDLTGLVSSNPVESVKRGRLGPALLQLTAFLLLFFVCKGARFGRPIQTQTIHRREFTEHVRALGLHYARARAERYALGCWGSYAIERLRERCGLRVDRSLSGLAEAVATRTGRPVGEVMRTLLEARDAKAGEPAEKGVRDLDTLALLCKLLEETGGTGGHKRIQSHV
jgi:hypothetical protein